MFHVCIWTITVQALSWMVFNKCQIECLGKIHDMNSCGTRVRALFGAFIKNNYQIGCSRNLHPFNLTNFNKFSPGVFFLIHALIMQNGAAWASFRKPNAKHNERIIGAYCPSSDGISPIITVCSGYDTTSCLEIHVTFCFQKLVSDWL